jgi:hypothetical protein
MNTRSANGLSPLVWRCCWRSPGRSFSTLRPGRHCPRQSPHHRRRWRPSQPPRPRLQSVPPTSAPSRARPATSPNSRPGRVRITNWRCRRPAPRRCSVTSPTSASDTTVSSPPSSSVATSSWSAPMARRQAGGLRNQLHLRPLSAAAVSDSFSLAGATRRCRSPGIRGRRGEGGQRWFHLYPDQNDRSQGPAALDRPLPELGTAVCGMPFDQSAQGLRRGQQ